MSAREYKTSTLVSEIRSRGIAVAGVDKEDVWWWSGHACPWSACHDWIEKHRDGIEAAMKKAAEDYFEKHREE
jgi:hypothetical protein